MGHGRRMQQGIFGAITVVVAASLSACASASEAASHHQLSTVASRPATVSPLGCSRGSAYQSTLGFELSIAHGVVGSPSPRQAAVTFVEHGGVSGFGTASTRWVLTRDDEGVMLHDATTFLHVVQLATGGWVVDSGGHCG